VSIIDRIADHGRYLAPTDRPPTGDPSNPASPESIAYREWERAAPRRLNCMGEDLRGLDFNEASLRMAGLKGADLRNCDLRKCDLHGADLRDCALEGANLAGAHVDASTRIAHIDLGTGLANRTSLVLLLEAVGGDPEEEQTRALVEALKGRTGRPGGRVTR
jgi:hypothetical protein